MDTNWLVSSDMIMKNICIVIGIIGVLSGLDLILGAKVIIVLKRILEKSIDIDRKIIDSKVKIGLGVIILALALTIFYLLNLIARLRV